MARDPIADVMSMLMQQAAAMPATEDPRMMMQEGRAGAGLPAQGTPMPLLFNTTDEYEQSAEDAESLIPSPPIPFPLRGLTPERLRQRQDQEGSLQQMIPMVLQQLQQNPQMLQQLMQIASGPAGQGILQMLMGQQGQDPRWVDKFQAGSGQESPVPLPGSLGGGTPYPTISPEQDDKAYLRELRQDRLQPPRYPAPPGLTPDDIRQIQQQKPRDVNPRDFPEEYLYPGNPEPVSQFQPGLLTRLAALSMPAQMMPQSKGYPITKDDIDLAQGDYLPDTPMDEEEEEEEEQEKNYKGGRG